MLPPKTSAPAMKGTSVYIAEDVLLRAHAIAEAEGVKSRNQLLGSFLAFAVDLFPHLKPLRKQVEEVASDEGISYAEAVALLVKEGLKARK